MSAESHAIAWIPVLDRIEQRLSESLAQATLPEPAAPLSQDPAWNPVARLENHLGQVQQQFVSIAANAADTDALLASTAMDLRQWLENFATSRQQLTDWAAGLGNAVPVVDERAGIPSGRERGSLADTPHLP